MKQYKIQKINSDNFDISFLKNVSFPQAFFYGNWQENLGRDVKRYVVSCDDTNVAYFQMVKYPLLFGKSYFYIPYGPVTNDFSDDFFIFIKQELQKIAQMEGAVFIRLDFSPTVKNDTLLKFFKKTPRSSYHSAYFQPRAELFLPLDKTENEILMDMHQKTRYSIRLAEKKDITTEIITENFEEYFESFYDLMFATAKRNNFGIHEKKYYDYIFKNASDTKTYLSIAKYNEKILAIDLIIVLNGVANYVFGGSSADERNRMPTYLAQWVAILHAKKMGCDYYNFGAISADKDSHKGWDGITAFKKKFGGKEMLHSDFFDIVTNPFLYHLYNFRKFLKSIM